MQIFRVGGCVRDALLREARKDDAAPRTDRDWVVVGATPQQMIDLGFRPVGKDFPVFLHPETQEEYALARTERKTRPGYRGFEPHASPDVTLEQDLARRDLTINAMAVGDDGQLVDPHGGRRDLEAGVLRHVSPSFVEDPVRILRLARFAARFPEFTVAPETAVLTRAMVDNGEADALVAGHRGQRAAVPRRRRVGRRVALAIERPTLRRLFAAPPVDVQTVACHNAQGHVEEDRLVLGGR